MTRTLVAPPNMEGAPLADLKAWLSISTRTDDPALIRLLESATSLCEQFTGVAPLMATYEERLSPTAARRSLVTRPVRRVVSVEQVAGDGSRSDAGGVTQTEVLADGTALVRATGPVSGVLIVTCEAGAADDWRSLDAALMHGILRLAAHSYRRRDDGEESAIPAAVVALWRPHRRLRL